MHRLIILLALTTPAYSQSLRGTVTDPSGAVIVGATVQLKGPARELRARTNAAGQYAFTTLPAGLYQIRITAKGFTAAQRKDVEIAQPQILDTQLAIHGEAQVIIVEDELRGINASAEANGGRVVLRERQLAALSDDPDELALQLQALAGPAPGPGGGEFFIDGFSGGRLPPKASIREVRINSNPFSPEYDRPGFSRIEVFTKPGSDLLHGQAFAQYNDQRLNARNPLLTQATRPPYRAQIYSLNLAGPIVRNKASFTFDADRRDIRENAFVIATTLDSNLNPVAVNQALPAPQTRTTLNPRLDYAINARNSLTVRFQDLRLDYDNQGVGDFNLASRAYNERQSEQTVQATENFVINAQTINESRAQFLRSSLRYAAANDTPAISVLGAFAAGGSPQGNSASLANNWEFTNTTLFSRGKHALRWGGRLRQSRLDDTSLNNFAGAYVFYSLAQYKATLLQLPGAGASQFSRNAGTPEALVRQTDAGLFLTDDWRALPNLTFSFGLRYEVQSNRGGHGNWAPRLAIAWGLDARSNRPAKTVLRAGFGAFFDRIPLNVTLNSLRYDGVNQQSYLILSPTFFPAVPSTDILEANRQPQQLRPVFRDVEAPQLFQGSLGIERGLNQGSRLSLTWITSRGVHLLNLRNTNAPIQGMYPAGDRSIRLLTESAGLSRLNQLVAGVNATYKKIYLFGSYTLSYGMANNEGIPADPYDLHAEWSPSSYGDVRHRSAGGATIPLPRKFSLSAFLLANSGQPYNITTGLDPYATGFPAARPALRAGRDAESCQQLTCFDLTPAPGVPTIGRNAARGPAATNAALRLSHTWSFGPESGSAPTDHSPMSVPTGSRQYNIVISASTLNALNHPNFATPNGVLTSPYFGQYRALGGLAVMSHGGAPSTYNRKIDLQLRLTW
ncbi:MAG: carboxypeptidase regulatory-like domain-containing protein [Candidatus Solibacter sp.]